MADKGASGIACRQLPQSQSLVPGGRERICTIGGNDAVGDDMGVTVEGSLGISVGSLVASQVPDDEGLVS